MWMVWRWHVVLVVPPNHVHQKVENMMVCMLVGEAKQLRVSVEA